MKKEKGVVDKKSLLREAIVDIDRELARLNKEKGSLRRQIGSIDSEVGSSQELEKKLQEKIAVLLKREAALSEKKKGTQVKIDRLSDKLGKIKKIKSEMNDV